MIDLFNQKDFVFLSKLLLRKIGPYPTVLLTLLIDSRKTLFTKEDLSYENGLNARQQKKAEKILIERNILVKEAIGYTLNFNAINDLGVE